MRTLRLLLLALLAVSSACSGTKVPGRDRPLVLVFGPAHTPHAPEQLRARLEQQSGLQLRFVEAASSEAAIDLLERGEADAGLLPLFDWLFCAELYDVQPLAQLLRVDGADSYEGEWVVRADATTAGISALAGQKVAFVDRWSVTGFLLPAAQLREARVPFEPLFVGSHEAVLAAVREGRAAAGATFVQVPAAPQGLRVLGSTGRIANEPLFVQAKVPSAERAALLQALLLIREPSALEGIAGATGFREPPPDAWRDARARIDAAGQRVTSLVAGGWQRANEHRRPLWSYAP